MPPAAVSPGAGAHSEVPADLAGLPWVDGASEAPVPTEVGSWPSIADDPPVSASYIFHVPEPTSAPRAPQAGSWSDEVLAVCGADGRWRELDLGSAGLPSQSWPNLGNLYGPGFLSPDGRWWAGRANTGVVFADLATGRIRFVASRRSILTGWLPDSTAVRVVTSSDGDNELVHLAPDGTTETQPGSAFPRAFDSAGRLVEVEEVQGDLVVTPEGGLAETYPDATPAGMILNEVRVAVSDSAVAVTAWRPTGREMAESRIIVFDRASRQAVATLTSQHPDGLGVAGWVDGRLLLHDGPSRVLLWDPWSGDLQLVLIASEAEEGMTPVSVTLSGL